MRKEIKKAFKNGTIEHISAFDTTGAQVWMTNDFDMFAVESDMGRKAFVTFDGAFNTFLKSATNMDIEVMFEDHEVLDIDTFLMLEEVASPTQFIS